MVANETDDTAARALRNSPLCHPEESYVEIVQIELANAPFALQPFLVGLDESQFLTGDVPANALYGGFPSTTRIGRACFTRAASSRSTASGG